MRKKWKYYIDRMLTFALIGILLPLFVTIICQRMRLEEVIYGTYNAITETAEREGGEELEEQLPFYSGEGDPCGRGGCGAYGAVRDCADNTVRCRGERGRNSRLLFRRKN